jgi:integral membrane sensor domain MASE1
VLAVEAVAAAVVLVAAVAARERFADAWGRWWIPVAASLLAYACLAL